MKARLARASGSLLAGLASLAAACGSTGPPSIARDRLQYSDAVAESWKEQTLLNIVKLRYMDLPVFLEVGQIVSGYTIETAVRAAGVVVWPSSPDNVSAGAEWRYTDRPTITYSPLTGERFLRQLISPIPLRSVFYLLQSGYPADLVLTLTLSSLGGIRNPVVTSSMPVDRGRDFLEVVRILRDLQLAGALGFRAEVSAQGVETDYIIPHVESVPLGGGEGGAPGAAARVEDLGRLLGLRPGLERFKLAHSPLPGDGTEITFQPRSFIQILIALSGTVEVPTQDEREGRTVPLPPRDELSQLVLPVTIRSSESRPENAYVAVPYRGRWFWVEDRDWRAKRVLGFVFFLFSVSETSATLQPPVITIPTG